MTFFDAETGAVVAKVKDTLERKRMEKAIAASTIEEKIEEYNKNSGGLNSDDWPRNRLAVVEMGKNK